jgi:hypothetical protein
MRGCRELCMERCREEGARNFMLDTNFILSPFNALLNVVVNALRELRVDVLYRCNINEVTVQTFR